MRTQIDMTSAHSDKRHQQRGIPEVAIHLLQLFGKQKPAGGKRVRKFFDKRAWKDVEGFLGHWPLKKMEQLRKCYLIESEDGVLVTVAFDNGKIKYAR